MTKKWLTYLLWGVMAPALAQPKLEVDNATPRYDQAGAIVDAHDGRVIRFGRRFYWYGTRYGATNGFTEANAYVCYSSDNLQDWRFEGELLPQKPLGVYYRPHVVFNPQTGKYVLWYNWYPKLWNGQFGVAESSSPTGPFQIVDPDVKVRHSQLGVGDLGVFVDDDGRAYLSYNTIQGHRVSVERLNASFTASTLEGSDFIASHCEAGSMFKHGGAYYLLTDYTCCFCSQGSGAQVFTASSPLGPYTFRQNINRYPGSAAPLLHDGERHRNLFEPLRAAQQNGLEVWLRKPARLANLTIHQFTGDRGNQCGQVDNPLVHAKIPPLEVALQYFADGEWKPLPVTSKTAKNQALQVAHSLSFGPVVAEKLRLDPAYPDTTTVINLAELELGPAVGPFTVFKTRTKEQRPIIPAQQTYVMELETPQGKALVWMGDLWGSASDQVKGHDYQFWAKPFTFYPNGLIKELEWVDKWSVELKR
jgi:hypothetical protein